MKSKALYFMRRAFAVLLVMAMIWSDTSIVSLAQTTASDDGTQQSEEPSSEPPVSASSEQTIVPEKETDGEAVTPTEEPTEEPAEPTEEPIEPAEEPTEPAEPESPEPSDAPLETPPLETLTPTATPAEMSPEMSVDLKASPNEEEPYVLRIGRTDTDDYNPESDMQIASDVEGAIIYICEKDSAVMLDESSVQEIKWYRAAQDEEFDLDADPCQTGACFFLNIEFFLVESRLRAVIKVSEDEQYELDVNHIQPGTCTSGQGALEGVLLPDHYIKIVGAEGSIFVDHSIFFRADDSNGANAEPISDGAAIGYCLAEEDNGKYIFARYGAWNDTEHKLDYYQTQIAGPIGYVVSENEEDWQHNAQLLQSAIDEAENLAAENNQRMQIYVPEGVKLKPAEGSIHFNNSICLYAYDVTLYGGVEVTKAVEFAEVDDGIAQNVVGGVHGLNIVKEGGIAVDAAKAPVWLNECSVSCSNGATMLQVSGDTYGKTAIYDCNVEFDQGGCILKLAAGSKTMPQEFALKNTNLRIQQISEGSTVAMLEYEEDAIDGSVRWNVEGLEPQSEATIKQLSAPENSLINNAFWVEGVNGMIANSGILTMQSVSKKWIHPKLADGTSFAGNDAYKIIVGTPEEYEVCCIPEDIDFAFRPYALTGQYGAGQGSYAKLLPAGFVTYIVIDVNQKEGFPYGALIGKRLEYAGDNYVLMQYYADKSVETVASVIDGEVVQRGDSILEALLKEGDAYRVLVNTEEDGEPVEEPIVLAVYSEMPSAKAGLKVFEEGELSDGQILTDETKKVSFELNGGIAKNYYDGDAFEINTAKCTVPEGSGMPAFEEDMSGSRAVLEIPEGAYGTLVVTAHYKSSVSAKEVKFTYTLQLTSVQNAEGFALDVKNAGGRYYGTATFDVFSGAVKPLLGVSAGKGENGEGDYNLKVTSFTISGSKVTVQYLLDSGDDNAWNDILNPARTPRLLIETVAGTYAISLETTGAEASVADEEIGVTYLFDLETDSESGEKFAVFTGALITDGNKFYPNGDEPRIAVPDKAKIKGENDSETTYDVTAMAEGCLNNIYENGAKAYAPDIVEIPASVTDIRGKLVTDPDYSNLRQIIVADGNPAYKTYGIAVDAAGKSRDDRQYCALYKVNEDHTELVEIASNYVGGLAWRSDAVWTDDTYSCNFSGITDFWCGDDYSGRYQSWDRMLVEVETKEEGDEAAVIKAPEYEIGSSLVLPEGIVTINAKALENVAITTLVLPSTMTEWKDNAVTQAKNIYVYQPDTDINPCEGLDRSLKGITFYGFVDEKQSSALKTWVLAAKGQSYKFVAMKESGETAADYSVKTLRESVVSERGIEYYPVSMGDELTETFDFDFSSKVVNGYPGKTDLTVELEQPGDDAEYMLQEGEFKEDFRDGSRIFEAVKPGVAKVVIKKGDSVIKTAYFVVKPNYCEINESNESEDGTERVDFGDMTFGEMKTLTVTPYYWDKDAGDNVAVTLESAAIQEYDKIGAIASLIPDERAVTGTNGKKYDAWQIELSEGDGLAYNVTPLLYEAENGEVKGGSETEIVLSLFGDRRSVYARAKMKGEEGSENKWLHVDDYNPLIERGETRYIPIYLWSEEAEKNGENPTPLAYSLTLAKSLQINEDGSSAYAEEDKTYRQAECEVVSGGQFVTAQIVSGSEVPDNQGNQDKAYLKITGNGKKDGKAEIRIYMPYREDYGDARITVSVGKDLVQRFALNLGIWNEESQEYSERTLDSTFNQEDDPDYNVFDVNEETIWKDHVIKLSDINNTTGDEPYSELPSSKLNWTVSDASLAKLVKGDSTDKNKVTGIQLTGEGTVLVTATVKDTNAATIRILFTVKNCKPRLHNDSAALDINDKHSVAEYAFAVPEGMKITDVQMQSAEINKKPVEDTSAFAVELDEKDTHKVKVTAEDPAKLAKGTGKLSLAITVAEQQQGGDNQEGADNQGEAVSFTYDYSVNLQLTNTQAKVMVTPENALDLGVLTGRETGLTVKVGDYSNSPSNTLAFDMTDTVTNSFSQYFTLEKENASENGGDSGRYVVKLAAANGKTPAEIAKLFNGKKIKLTIASDDYAAIASETTTVTFKIAGTTPVLKPSGGGKITVDTSAVDTYKDGAYGSRMSYTLTEGFLMSEGTYEGAEAENTLGTIRIAEKQAAYADKFTFNQSEGELEVMVDPGVPKGTYQFTWTAKASAKDEGAEGQEAQDQESQDTIFGWQNLKEQKISVVVSGSKAKIALSTTKLTLNKNYLYTTADANFQFDESQIRMIYGPSCWFNNYAVDETLGSITLVKAPKNVTADTSKVNLGMEGNNIIAGIQDEDAVAGEYKYSITPYIYVGMPNDENDEESNEAGENEKKILMALAPVTLSVQVTDSLPAVSLDKTSVTLDNNDLSLRTLINLNVKGNYEWIDGEATTIVGTEQPGAPIVQCWGSTIAVMAGEDTLKGTYKFTITPDAVLDSCPSNEGDGKERNENHKSLKPVVLTVKVNSTRPTLKLAKGSLTVYSYYPGFDNEEGFYIPAEAETDIATSNGYAVRDINVEPADAKTQTLQDNEEQEIRFSCGYDREGNILCFDAIPKTDTPKGTYNYLVYAKTDGDVALEPVKLRVTVNSNKPDLKLSTNSAQILAGWQGSVNITLTDKAECVSNVTGKTEYLIKKDGKWQICAEREAQAEEAYAVLTTHEDGSVTIETGSKAASLAKAETAKAVAYEQEVYLKGNNTPYTSVYSLTISFGVINPAAVVSAKTIAVNKNYDFGSQESNYLRLSLSNGAEITRYDIDDMNAGNKKDAIVLVKEGEAEAGGSEIIFRVFPDDRPETSLEKGNYSFRITPYAENRKGEEIKLSPVTVTVQVKEETPTIKADKTKVTINGLDTREDTWQDINLSANMAYADDNLEYTVEITKGPKGVDLSEIDFFPRGWQVDKDGRLTIASTDTETPAGTYQVTVTPYASIIGGNRMKLKAIIVSVTVTAPKVTAALQTAKMSIDVADPANIDMQNAIVLTGTNAELVNKIWWKGEGWKLTKKPKGAGENEIWIDELQAREQDDKHEEHDGKSFCVRWGDPDHDYSQGPRWTDITPGTYEFTLTPADIESAEGVKINTPAPLKLTVTVKNSIPTIKYSKTSSKLNALFGTKDPVYFTLSDTSWNVENVDAVLTAWPKDAGAEKANLRIGHEGNRLMVEGSDKVPAGTYTFMLEAEAQKNGLQVPLKQQKFTVTVKNDIPTVKISSSKITLNTLYAGWYGFEGNPADNFNKNRQTKLTLAQNYGASHFEPGEFKISFTGKDNQRPDASKIEWRVYDDGTIAAGLPWGSVVTAGSYSFEITPVLRSDETGAKITLKPVKVTVAVESKALKASAKASGKIDLLNREGSGITYQVALSDKNLDAVSWINLAGPEKGDDYSGKFELLQDPENHPDQCIIRAREEAVGGEEFSTSVNYEMRLEVHTVFGKTYYVPVKIKPTQSKINLTTDIKALTLFKQGSWDTAATVQVKAAINNTKEGQLTILSGEEGVIATGSKDFKAYEVSNSPEDGCGIRLIFASEAAKAKYKAGSKVTVPIYVQIYNQAVNTYTTSKINITVTVKN